MRTSAFAITVAGLLAACGPAAPETGQVDLIDVTLTSHPSKPDQLRLRLRFANGTVDTAYVYDQIRGVFREEATSTTTLRLRDQPCSGNIGDAHLLMPSETQLPPLAYQSVELDVPRAYAQLTSTGTFTDLPVADAKQIVVEVAWSDRPFDLTRAEGMQVCLADSLIAKQRGVASKTARRNP